MKPGNDYRYFNEKQDSKPRISMEFKLQDTQKIIPLFKH
jgi:hypothetical protein